MQNQSILIKKEHASAPCIEISEKFGVYKERKNIFFSKSVNSLLGDSHNGQCCSQQTRIRRDLHFFKIKYELVSLVLRLFKSWGRIDGLGKIHYSVHFCFKGCM